MSVQDLESAVTQLTPEELSAFSRWFEDYVAEKWDQQIERDALAGRFDDAAARAKADFEQNRCTPL